MTTTDPFDPHRQAVAGAAILDGIEADLLGIDSQLRKDLARLHLGLAAWSLAAVQAVAIHLRLVDGDGDGYTSGDLDAALTDYRNATQPRPRPGSRDRRKAAGGGMIGARRLSFIHVANAYDPGVGRDPRGRSRPPSPRGDSAALVQYPPGYPLPWRHCDHR